MEGIVDVHVTDDEDLVTLGQKGKGVVCDRDETGVGTRREVSTEQEEKEQQRYHHDKKNKRNEKWMDGQRTATMRTAIRSSTKDALLTERDKERPTDANAAGCPPTRKPCKDCTCGRKRSRRGERKQQRECGGENGFGKRTTAHYDA